MWAFQILNLNFLWNSQKTKQKGRMSCYIELWCLAGGSLSCSDHEIVELRILRGGSRAISRIKILDFGRANFGLFKDLLGGIPWVRALDGRGVQKNWSLFKHHFLHAQDRCIHLSKKSGKGGRRPV